MATVLVIDDEPHIRELVAMVLKAAGHKVIGADNGKAGLRLLLEHQPDVVLTDIYMPEQDGIETLLAIKRLALSARIVVMSGGGRHGMDLLEAAGELGAAAVLRKPFRKAELLAAIGSHPG